MAEGLPASYSRRRGSVGSIGDDENQSTKYNDDDDMAEEIADLQRRGILPPDFPSKSHVTDNDNVNCGSEIDELLALGAISKSNADAITNANCDTIDDDDDNIHESEAVIDPRLPNLERPSHSFCASGFPLNWSQKVNNGSIYNLVTLKRSDEEFKVIQYEFEKVDIKVTNIERLQSPRMLDRFKAETDDVRRHRNESFDVNVCYLYHGTSVEKVRLCEEGLDQRLSRMGYFGKGIYFSDTPLKCVHYADDPGRRKPDEAYILKCRVVLGDVKVYAPGCYDTDLKREPEKDDMTEGWRYYDSVVGCPKDYNEYVVYENRRAMIEYIIGFQVDKQTMLKLRSRSLTANKAAQNKQISSQSKSAEARSPPRLPSKQHTVEPLSTEDHHARIREVREAVRRKRQEEKRNNYKSPSQHDERSDEEKFSRLQELHQLSSSSDQLSDHELGSEMWETSPEVESRMTNTTRNKTTDMGFASNEIDPKDHEIDETVGQVLDMCIFDFLQVTGTDDSDRARYFVQKANMDVNNAISLYYEET